MNRILFGCLFLLTACQASLEVQSPQPQKTTVLEDIAHPWSMAFLSEEEVIISEKDRGLLRANLRTKAVARIPNFPTDLADSIRVDQFGDNSGVFEVLADPLFAKNQWIYVSYAAKAAGGMATKVVRAQLTGTEIKNIQTLLLAGPHTFERYHYGGGMTFGPDGKLYITAGERLFWEHDEPPLPIAQDSSDRRGKIYRINKDGSIPDDNPDFGPGAVPGLYALGIRAAQGICVEPDTDRMWFSEHGTTQGDEINLLQAGANYGWPLHTSGRLRSKDYTPPKLPGPFTDPIWYWEHTVAPTGLTFYTGTAFPTWRGNLLVPGLSKGSLWRFTLDGTTIKSAEELMLDDRVRSRKVVQSPAGVLYLLTDEPAGKVICIDNANG
ncbi:MAG: PQQ-dependent sugar dehydrogenase [Bacteroidota bacterium]